MSQYENLEIQCQDGYTLHARFYSHQTAHAKSLPVLICPATGITKQFYHAYATWLAILMKGTKPLLVRHRVDFLLPHWRVTE